MQQPQSALVLSGKQISVNCSRLQEILYYLGASPERRHAAAPRRFIDTLLRISQFMRDAASHTIAPYQAGASAMPSAAQRAEANLRAEGDWLAWLSEALFAACAHYGYPDCAPAAAPELEQLCRNAQAHGGPHAAAASHAARILADAAAALGAYFRHLVAAALGSACSADAIAAILRANTDKAAVGLESALKLLSDCDLLMNAAREFSSCGEDQVFTTAEAIENAEVVSVPWTNAAAGNA